MLRRYYILIMLSLFALVSGCKESEVATNRKLGVDEFVPRYNEYVAKWIKGKLAGVEEKIKKIEGELTAGANPAKQAELEELKREQQRYLFRQSLGSYFAYKTPADIPTDLVWENGLNEPEIGDPKSKKGGVFRNYLENFPATIRPFGPEASTYVRGYIYDDQSIGLVGLHPKTQAIIPGLAKEWAVSKDAKTVFFKLHDGLKYSNNDPLVAKDFIVGVYVRISDYVANPFHKQYLLEQIANVTIYDDKTLSISLPDTMPFLPLNASVPPSSQNFYKDYGADYVERYQWRHEPTTGPYYIKDEDVKKGVSLTLSRNPNWWGNDKKFYKYLYNPDKIVYTVVRDKSKTFELFRSGEIDFISLTEPEYWYQKSEVEPVFDGYIERYTFYNQYPRSPRGFFFNLAKPPLNNKDLRWGIQHALNWQKVIDVQFRGDFSRLEQFTAGYGVFVNPEIKAPKFNIRLAREYFAKAGYTVDGSDGILKKPSGERLQLSVTYGSAPLNDRMLSILKEDAKRAGLDLQLDGNEATVFFKKISQKEHQACLVGYSAAPPAPDYYQYLHSSTAFDEKGQPKPDTNNLFSYKSDRMDQLTIASRFARNNEEMKTLCWEIQKILYDEAMFSPSFMPTFVRFGCWRWMRWPDTEETKMSPPIYASPIESYTWWIDEDIKNETLAAKRAGKTFPEVQRVMDEYRDKSLTK